MAQADIELTPLWKDIQSTIFSGPKAVQNDILISIHTEKLDFPIIKLLTWEEKADYLGNIGASINLKFQVGMGDYVYKLYPFRDNLEVSVKRIPQLENNATDLDKDIEVIKYKAILKPDMNAHPTGGRLAQMAYSDLNIAGIMDVHLEIQDRMLEPLRVKTSPGGIIRNKTMKQAIYGMLMGESQNVMVDGKFPVDGIDIVEPSNTEPVPHILVPTGINISQFPSYLQDHSVGVYSAGMGTFFQRYKEKYYWYVYTLYDPNRFDEDVDRMVFFAVPPEKLPGIDRTYRVAGKVTYVVVTGERSYMDNGAVSDLNQGLGFRMADANAMMKKPIEITEEGPKAIRSRLNTEVASHNRADGNIYAPVVGDSANPYKFYSSVAARNLARVDVVWENSDPDLIYPGMPCKYVFMDKDEYKERKGTIIGKYTVRELIGRPHVSNTYRTATHVGIMLEPFEEAPPQMPKMNAPGNF